MTEDACNCGCAAETVNTDECSCDCKRTADKKVTEGSVA